MSKYSNFEFFRFFLLKLISSVWKDLSRRPKANKSPHSRFENTACCSRFSLTSMIVQKLDSSNRSYRFWRNCDENLPLKRQGSSPAGLLAVQCVVRSSSGCRWLWFSHLQSRRWTYPPRNPGPSLQTERCLETVSRLSLQMHYVPLKWNLLQLKV